MSTVCVTIFVWPITGILGQIANDKTLDDMIKEAPGPINFTVFLTLFGERLTGTDPEDIIVGAFKMFDKKDTGSITEDE